MKPPSPKALDKWTREQPDGDYTCAWCGKVGPHHYVQPQHPYWADGKIGQDGKAPARCMDCYNAAVLKSREDRKAVLKSEPRCEVTGCSRRGAWKSGGALLCGGHLKAAKVGHAKAAAGLGILGCLMEYDRNDILAWASNR